MPSIQVTGQLIDPTTGVEGSADIRIASVINYGQTTKKSISHKSTDANGNYDFPLVYGKHLIFVKYEDERIYIPIGYAVVGDSTPDPVDLIQLINLSDENPPSELVTELQKLREDTLNDIVSTSVEVLENSGYKGLWPDTGGSALKGETWQTQVGGVPTGEYYTALKETTVNPINDDINWKEQLNKATQVIHYKGSGTNSAYENMITESPVAIAVGDICKTGSMSWMKVGATIPAEADDFQDRTANVFDFGEEKTSTINKMIQAGIKRIIIPISLEADETLKPAQGVFLDTGNGWCTITNNIPNGDPFVKWDSNTDGGILRWFRWGNFLINNGTATGPIFDLFGIQHCKFGDFWTINSKGGTISFAYFNTFDKIQLQNLKEPLVFTGVSQSTDCNFNYIGRVTINNWIGEGLVIENSRGNTIVQFDAETGIAMTGPALHLQDSSYNKVEHFWSEAITTSTSPTILINAVISQSRNKKNIIEHVPQIITPATGIEVSNSIDTKIGEARLVGCAVGIDDAGGNGGLVIHEPQFDNCTTELNITSNDTLVQRKPNQIEGKVNVNYTVNSINGGFGGYEYRVGGDLRWKVGCKSAFDVDITTGRGLAAQWIDNPGANRSQYSLRSGLHFAVAVTGADVQPNSLFRDSTDQKLKYKDASSVIHLLY